MLSLINLDKDSYETLCLVEKHPDRAEALLDEDTYKYFVKNKVLVKEYEDKDYIKNCHILNVMHVQKRAN